MEASKEAVPLAPSRRRLALAVLLFLGLAIPGLLSQSGTCDELGAHIPAGILAWRSGSPTSGLANPPLGHWIIGAGPTFTGTADRPLANEPRPLLPARLPVLALGAGVVLLCAALALRATNDPRAGALAALVAALCPNLGAHAQLATLDVPVTAFGILAAWFAWKYARSPRPFHLAAYAVALGAAASTKFTGLHLLPAVALGGLLDVGPGRERVRRCAWLLAAGVAGIVLVSWATYGPGPAAGVLPGALVEGVAQKWRHGLHGHWAYLGGQVDTRGFPHYFLVALAVKLPIATSLSSATGAWFASRAASRLPDARGLLAYLIVPALWIFAALSLVHRVDVGVRHVLPVFPALFVLAGIGLAHVGRRGQVGRIVAGSALLWLLVTTVRISPDPIAYFHELAGGPLGGERILIDSNLDWGQDDARFRAALAESAVTRNPRRPVEGRVAANINARHGILSRDDRRLRWLDAMPVAQRVGNTWRVYDAHEKPLREAARRDPVAALDYAHWLTALGRPAEALRQLARNDLSRHETRAGEWFGARAEAYLALGDVEQAARDVGRIDDADLALEIAYRAAERAAAPPESWSPALRAGIVAALARRGHEEEADLLCRRLVGHGLDELDPPGSVDRARRWRAFGRERDALVLAGEILAREPHNDDALWLYGELVVRRKLGITEYPLPVIDWSRP